MIRNNATSDVVERLLLLSFEGTGRDDEDLDLSKSTETTGARPSIRYEVRRQEPWVAPKFGRQVGAGYEEVRSIRFVTDTMTANERKAYPQRLGGGVFGYCL